MEFIETDTSSNTETIFRVKKSDKHGNISIIKQWSIKKYPPKSKHFSTKKTQKNSSSKKFNRIKSSDISTNSMNIVLKNHGSISLHSPKAFQSFCNYFADHNDNKNENKEKVSLIYFNPAGKTEAEVIQKATNKNDKLALEKKAFNEMGNDCITTAKNLNKRFAKSLGQKLVLSLPPEISKEIANDKLLFCALNTLAHNENFKNHKALLGIHEDQINTNKHKHIHIFLAYSDGQNHNLHFENRKELRVAYEKFRKEFSETLNKFYPEIKLDYKSKEKFYGDLRKGILFEGYDEVNKKIICKDINGNHRSNEFCKEAYDIAKKMNLQPGDKFDYTQTKSNRPKLYPKTKKPVYYKGQIQYLNDYSFENIQRYQDLKREFYTQAEQLQKQAREQEKEQERKKEKLFERLFDKEEQAKEQLKEQVKEQETKSKEQVKEQAREQEKLQDKLFDKELELESARTSYLFKNQFMKQYEAHITGKISQDEYTKNLTEFKTKIEKECNYDDYGYSYTQKDLEYIEKEINKIKPNEPENISKLSEIIDKSNEIQHNTNTQRTISPKPKKKDRDISR